MLSAGDPAPDFVLPVLTGGTASLSDLTSARGRLQPVLLAFLKVSCPVCQYTFPFLERLAKAPGLSIVGISQDDEADTARFWRSCGLSFPALLDEEASNYPVSSAYRLTNVPSRCLSTSTTRSPC